MKKGWLAAVSAALVLSACSDNTEEADAENENEDANNEANEENAEPENNNEENDEDEGEISSEEHDALLDRTVDESRGIDQSETDIFDEGTMKISYTNSDTVEEDGVEKTRHYASNNNLTWFYKYYASDDWIEEQKEHAETLETDAHRVKEAFRTGASQQEYSDFYVMETDDDNADERLVFEFEPEFNDEDEEDPVFEDGDVFAERLVDTFRTNEDFRLIEENYDSGLSEEDVDDDGEYFEFDGEYIEMEEVDLDEEGGGEGIVMLPKEGQGFVYNDNYGIVSHEEYAGYQLSFNAGFLADIVYGGERKKEIEMGEFNADYRYEKESGEKAYYYWLGHASLSEANSVKEIETRISSDSQSDNEDSPPPKFKELDEFYEKIVQSYKVPEGRGTEYVESGVEEMAIDELLEHLDGVYNRLEEERKN
ncbi:hypothetical protein [Salisediminibacterium halotolerans]|uniref:hypothetical protein n=1 Tax=Salisediminibacterium halotolerans TaxID=517425 RepID=UPI000EB4EAA2|nr:hypothetical protein [Salisediminibacterium halotolerans]RLJ72203.1 hypothetical protein BCL39_2095 [Actinophytocola xinjiangensis]RPE85416.1 hypothetical protein EDD67_2230 [Salisediminibacterium halotolerans]TWG33373.1 hypothetical protein BCL52_2092 [Salisediminibacterium halotolerans]GEL07097.1 hypothetical protein SHA02_05130 [Salisediminibacterium halotolerans]